MYTAGHKVISRSFRRAAAEDGRFDVKKAMLFKVISHRLDDATSQFQSLLHLRTAQVDVAVAQAQVLAGKFGLAGREGWLSTAIEQLEYGTTQLNISCT